jgi:hypothetical protein
MSLWIKPVYQQNATLPRVKTNGDRPMMTMSSTIGTARCSSSGYIILKRMCGPRHSAASDLGTPSACEYRGRGILAVDGLDRVLAGKGEEAFGWI